MDSIDGLIGERILINRSIEFPPEFYQAGLNILSFFGTYLKEQYPEEDMAKVRIEQDGNLVRLIVEKANGESETVEKALEEYQLIISGQKLPEEVIINPKLLLELKAELRMAYVRIENQRDIIQIQNRQNDDLKKQIETLFTLLGKGLEKSNEVNIDFKPTIIVSNTNSISVQISDILSGLSDLKNTFKENTPEHKELKILEEEVSKLKKINDSETIKKSSALTKVREFIEKVNRGNEQISKTIKTIKSS